MENDWNVPWWVWLLFFASVWMAHLVCKYMNIIENEEKIINLSDPSKKRNEHS